MQMRCAWNELLSILPLTVRDKVDKLGRTDLQEIRMRQGRPMELVVAKRSIWSEEIIRSEDIRFVINAASKYSPWAAATSARGYITAPGGHRIGMCGECILRDGEMSGIRAPMSLCIRVARDFPGTAKQPALLDGSILILGPPGSGKTTLLRDLIRQKSDNDGSCVAVVDERGELFPPEADFPSGKRTDVLFSCGKKTGIEIALRTMNPGWIAVDEITSPEDCEAVIQANGCGVRLMATAHGQSVEDLQKRDIYKRLYDRNVFSYVCILSRDKSYRLERMER